MESWMAEILNQWTVYPEEAKMHRKGCDCVIDMTEHRTLAELVVIIVKFEQNIHPQAHAEEN